MSITKKDYFTSSNRYPDRLNSEELTQDVEKNAEELLKRVNALLLELGVNSVSISSGFRPSGVNSQITNAAKRSAHQSGEALDIIDDKDQSLCKKITKDVLELFDLYREDSDYTKGKNTNWCHIQTRPTRSGKRIFKP